MAPPLPGLPDPGERDSASPEYNVAVCKRRRLRSTTSYRTPFEAPTDHRAPTTAAARPAPRICQRSLTQIAVLAKDQWPP
jgi:hypothetical protein